MKPGETLEEFLERVRANMKAAQYKATGQQKPAQYKATGQQKPAETVARMKATAAANRAAHGGVTPKQKEAAILLARGLSIKEIAFQTKGGTMPPTTNVYRLIDYAKINLKLSTNEELIEHVKKMGWDK